MFNIRSVGQRLSFSSSLLLQLTKMHASGRNTDALNSFMHVLCIIIMLMSLLLARIYRCQSIFLQPYRVYAQTCIKILQTSIHGEPIRSTWEDKWSCWCLCSDMHFCCQRMWMPSGRSLDQNTRVSWLEGSLSMVF